MCLVHSYFRFFFIIQKRPELRLVISSATLDAEELKNYIELNKNKKSCLERSTLAQYQVGSTIIMNVVGRCYPVDIFYAQGKIRSKDISRIIIILHNATYT